MSQRTISDHETEFINWWSLSIALTFTAITMYGVLKDASFRIALYDQHRLALVLICISIGVCIFNIFEYIYHHVDSRTQKPHIIGLDFISLFLSIVFILGWIFVQGILVYHMQHHAILGPAYTK